MGVAVDVYHTWWDPELKRQIERAGEKRLMAFHFCDWLVPTTDLLLDRGMMGDGVIDFRAIRREVEAEGFDGFVEVEILSTDWWSRPIDEVLDTVIARYRSVV
jgi:sugar phosphate isomerase/epimerase